MKQMKRLAAWICALMIGFAAFPMTVSAASADITVGNVTADPGDTVEIPITITKVEKAVAISMHVQYDDDVLECVSATMSDDVSSMNLANANTKPVNHPDEVWLAAVSSSEKTLDGNVMTITFKVKDDAPVGKTAVTIDSSTGLSVVVNPNYTQVALQVENGAVTVGGEDESNDTTTTETTSTAAKDTTTKKKPTTTTKKSDKTTGTASDVTTTAKKTTTTAKRTTKTTEEEKTTSKKPTTTTVTTTVTTTAQTTITEAPTEATASPSKEPSRIPSKIPSKPPTEAPIEEEVTDAPTQPTQDEQVDTTAATTVTTTTKKTTVKKTTTTTKPQSTTAVTTTAVTVTSPKGDTIEITEDTAVDIQGAVVTTPNGKPSLVQTVAVMIDSITATPEQTVTVGVSLSDVKAMTVLGISLYYDPTVMTFESGDCVGFLKDTKNKTAIVENERGIVDISMMGTDAIGGSGKIAELRFTIRKDAKNGDHRVSVSGNPLIQSVDIELPVKVVAGSVTVEGGVDADAHTIPSYMAIPAVIAVALITLTVALIVRRKKSANDTAKPAAVIDVSGDEDE